MKRIKLTTVLLATFIINAYSIDLNDSEISDPEIAVSEITANDVDVNYLASNNIDATSVNAFKDSVRTVRSKYVGDDDLLNLKFNTLRYNPPKPKKMDQNMELLPIVNQGLTISEPFELDLNINKLNSNLYNPTKNELSFWNKATKRSSNMDKWDRIKIIGLYSASIICNSIGDGMNNTNRKTMGHLFNAASIGFLVASPFVVKYEKDKWFWYLLSYTSLRLAFFDAGYNLTTKKPIDFIGTTAPTDKLYRAVGAGYNISKSVGLLLGFTVPLKFI